MVTKKQLTDKIKIISKHLSGDLEEDDELIAEHQIKGSGESFFFSYIERNFIKLPRGMQIYIIAENFDMLNRTLAYTCTHELILIEPDEILYLGFN